MQDYIVNVSGDESNAAWLIKGDKNVLYDAGMAYSAGRMVEKIKRELDGAPLDAVLLSHSHYDHVAGLPFLRKEWPGLTAYGSAYAARILEKPSVRKTIRQLSGDAARGAGLCGAPEYDENGLKIDVIVKEEDRIVVGSHEIVVYETPGHTRCSLSYLVDQDVMFTSETVGVFARGKYMPCYLVGYQMCLDAVEKLRRAPVKRVFISHRGILEGEASEAVWNYLESEIKKSRDEITDIIKGCSTEEEQLKAMKEKHHDSMVTEAEQPSFAFLLNAAATLKVVKTECMGRKHESYRSGR